MPPYADAVVTPAGWSLGTLIGLPVAVALALCCLCLIVFGLLLATHRNDRGVGLECVGVGLGTLLVVAAVTGFAMWPWKASYHRFYHVTGTVDRDPGIRVVAADKGMFQRVVLVIGGVPYGVDDTRATLVHKGDRVSLMCKRDYQFHAASDWVCNWDGPAPGPS